jgi:dihydrofolate reductase
MISAVVAMSEDRVIGKDNQLPWRLPADLRHFKSLTTGNPIVMGRKTYESIGKPLPNRTNIICTRNPEYSAPGCIVVTSALQAIHSIAEDSSQIFIIGGAEIYQLFMPMIERIYLTIVHHVFDGDAYFPELDSSRWNEISRSSHESDNENPYPYSFVLLEKNCR